MALVPVISSLKQRTSVLALFFYHAYYLRYRNHIYWKQNSKLFPVVAFVSLNSSLKQTILVFTSFFYCLISKLQEQPSLQLSIEQLLEFWPFENLFLASKCKHTKFGANQFIHSHATSKCTRAHMLAHAQTRAHTPKTYNFNLICKMKYATYLCNGMMSFTWTIFWHSCTTYQQDACSYTRKGKTNIFMFIHRLKIQYPVRQISFILSLLSSVIVDKHEFQLQSGSRLIMAMPHSFPSWVMEHHIGTYFNYSDVKWCNI
jgi:hypothetical protein